MAESRVEAVDQRITGYVPIDDRIRGNDAIARGRPEYRACATGNADDIVEIERLAVDDDRRCQRLLTVT